ncbi:MAG: flavodoxin family protein [Campylobacter sp.]|nr:flavodoxin family protein [Campylobacter sp.]
MSKILLINGSPNKNGSTNLALSEIAKELENNGVQSEILYLGKKAINDCIACFSCTKTGRCAIKDDSVNDIIQRLDEFDGIVAGSPVYYAGPTARIQAFLTRLFFVGGNKFSGKIGASVLIARRGGASASFDRLNKFFTIANMFLAGSQYWNEAHAMTPDDLPKDEEGLQTMRTLAKNIAWFVKNKEFAKNAVAMPEYEEQILTNFIR